MQTVYKKSRKKYVVVTLVVIAVVAATGAWMYYRYVTDKQSSPAGSSTINYNTPTKDEVSTGDSIKNSSSTDGGSDASPAPTASSDGTSPSVGMEITAANQDNNTLYVRTLIQTVTSSGTCTLTMTGPGSKSYTTTSGVQALPSTSTCSGFNIPLTNLSTGDWSISVNFSNNSVKASASKEVTVQ